MRIYSFSPFGYEGALVAVEVDLRRGIPAVDLVGLADNAVRESRERMRAAIRNSGFEFPAERVLISLSPADVKKEGAGFDLAIALAVLYKKQYPETKVETTEADDVLVMGELELSGRVRPVRGVYAALSTAHEYGIRYCVIPAENKAEAASFSDMTVCAAQNLAQAFKSFVQCAKKSQNESGKLFSAQTAAKANKAVNAGAGTHEDSSATAAAGTGSGSGTDMRTDTCGTQDYMQQKQSVSFAPFAQELDFKNVAGQPFLIRALQTAAAGRHNLMVYGPPGCGKTLALKRFYTLLPLLTEKEAFTVTRIHSLAGNLISGKKMIYEPPFRMPHQSSTLEGIIGGGTHCRPGEISLAHNGVLFLDEASEFRISVLQALRVPLEEGKVSLSRAGRTTEYPARFQLLLAANPCPCGNFGCPDKICLCAPRAIEQYWRRFSAPLLDRIDIRVALSAPEDGVCGKAKNGSVADKNFSTEELRKSIAKAVAVQRRRQQKPNSYLEASEINTLCPMDNESADFLNVQSNKFGFSARGIHSCIKIARTIADMEECQFIQKKHVEEAVLMHRNEGSMQMLF